MKKLIYILMFIPSMLYSQQNTIHPEFRDHLGLRDELIYYQEVVPAEGLSKNDIFVRMNEWFVRTFNSPKNVIQMQDKEAGKLMGKYSFTYKSGKGMFSVLYYIDCILSFEAREGRYRLEASNFTQSVSFMNATNTGPLEVMFSDREISAKEIERIIEYADYISNEVYAIFDSAKSKINISSSEDNNW